MPSDLPQLSNNDFIKSWNLLNLKNDYMPIISPIFPEQNTAFNTNEFTRDIIVKEMKKAYAQLYRSTSLLTEKFYKDILFKKLEYKKQYEHFLVLVCSEKVKIEDINENKSCEFVKTKVRGLLVRWTKKTTLRFKIEENTAENVEENYKIYKLSDYLEEYHVLTNLEWKCNDGDNKRLTIWLVGINFKKGNFENRKIEKENILLLIPSFNFFTNYIITENYRLDGIHITRRNIGELDSLIEDGTINCPKIEDIESKEKTNEKWKGIQVDQRRLYLANNPIEIRQPQNEETLAKKIEILPKPKDIKFEISTPLQDDFYVKIPVNAEFYKKEEFKEYRKEPLKEEKIKKKKAEEKKGKKLDITS